MANIFGFSQAGKRFESQDALRPAARFREVRPGAYLPVEFLRDNELDGVHGAMIVRGDRVGLAGSLELAA